MSVFNKKVLVLGISGATCSGKSTIAYELSKLLPDSRIFCQDDYYFPVEDERHVWIPKLNHINFDIVSSLDMARMTQDIIDHIKKESSKILPEKPFRAHQAICFREEKLENLFKITESRCHIVIIEGFCIFNYKPLADICDLKYYFTLEYEECFRRRVQRVYEPPDCPGYFEQCAWPEHLKQLEEVRRKVEGVVFYDESSTNQSEDILRDITKMLK